MNIGFIGFGEVGYEMAKGFRAQNDKNKVYVYDHLHDNPKTIERAETIGAVLFDVPEKVARQTLSVLFTAVPASFTKEAWSSIESYINKETIYIDLTTASAEVKKQISNSMIEKNQFFVDGAIMGPLKGNQHKVPIMVSGNGAEAFIEWGRKMEMNLEFVNETPGDATNIKFIRSIFTKGLSTLLHELMETASALDLEDTILQSITHTMDKEPFENILNRLITGNVQHSERRVKEMENVADFMLENNVEPVMTRATRDKLKAITESNIREAFMEKEPNDWKEVIHTMNQK
ncbi:DUF1932 domain-containing protein [Sinobaca sp. H24]|uniref:DUF1932 domain-containing protein n=1 Tax=Sinobaca sp. H24 TaxID=2923376 RepID=UPI00207AA025|nr:DUF1932 domain-containing protein [Sinobaca sp. H24]